MTHRGFSLAELLVSLVIAGIIGIALTRLVVNQARFVDLEQSMMEARSTSRAGFNVVVSELRTVTKNGLIKLSRDTVEARVPLSFGVACGQPSGGNQATLLFPYDSANYAAATINGLAWQDSAGTWRFTSPVTVSAGTASDCTSLTPAISQPSASWKIIRTTSPSTETKAGAAAYVYQRIRYYFNTSTQVSGRRALWREVVGGGSAEELVAPFDTSSHFTFLTTNHLTPSTTPPAVFDSLRGIRIKLVGQSVGIPEGRSAATSFTMTSDIVLVNRAIP